MSVRHHLDSETGQLWLYSQTQRRFVLEVKPAGLWFPTRRFDTGESGYVVPIEEVTQVRLRRLEKQLGFAPDVSDGDLQLMISRMTRIMGDVQDILDARAQTKDHGRAQSPALSHHDPYLERDPIGTQQRMPGPDGDRNAENPMIGRAITNRGRS